MFWFEVYQEKTEWCWRFWSPYNRVIARSPNGYISHALCDRAIEILRVKIRCAEISAERNNESGDKCWYEIYKQESGWCWRFRSSDDRIIAIAPPDGYKTYKLCQRAIDIFGDKSRYAEISIKKNSDG